MAIITRYKDINFRSRLEARWAAFFDGMGWRWHYEPAEFDGWIPHFRLDLAEPVWVEVKPESDIKGLTRHEERLCPYAKETRQILLLGERPIMDDPPDPGAPVLGRLHEGNCGFGMGWCDAVWMVCGDCGRVGFYHPTGQFHSRVCGHQDGDHFLCGLGPAFANINTAWAMAGNATQWRAHILAKLEFERWLRAQEAGVNDSTEELERRIARGAR